MSFPTATLSSAYMIAAIVVVEGRSAAYLDIGGTYLYADIKPRMVNLLSVMILEYQPFISADGTLVVQHKKALYGLV